MTFFRFQIESSTIYIPVTSFCPKSQLDGPILGQTHPVPVPWISQFPLGSGPIQQGAVARGRIFVSHRGIQRQ